MAFITPTTGVDPTAAGTSSLETANSVGRLAEDFETFLRLLTTQLQNQNPTEPLEANEFVNQLTQFSQLEQQIRTNTSLEDVTGDIRNASNVQILSLVGNIVEGNSDQVSLAGGQALFGYRLGQPASDITISLFDEDGTLVSTLDEVPGSVGRNEVVWDGTDNDGDQLPDGNYRAVINASNAEGDDVIAEQFLISQVQEVRLSADRAELVLPGDVTLGFDNLASVYGRPVASSGGQPAPELEAEAQ